MSNVTRKDADLECERAEHLRAVHRAALGQQVDDAEIGEGEDRAKDHGDQNNGHDDWQDDLIVAPPEARTVNGSSIEHVFGHRGEPGQKNHHAKRKQAPGMHHRDRQHGQVLLAQPLRGAAGSIRPTAARVQLITL
jgi:hypothetical protein